MVDRRGVWGDEGCCREQSRVAGGAGGRRGGCGHCGGWRDDLEFPPFSHSVAAETYEWCTVQHIGCYTHTQSSHTTAIMRDLTKIKRIL